MAPILDVCCTSVFDVARSLVHYSLNICAMAQVVVQLSAVVISGGDLRSEWIPKEIISIDDSRFFRVNANDRKLAAFCGADLTSSHPLGECVFIHRLIQMRNTAMKSALQVLADTDELAGKPARGRKDLFEDLPRTIPVMLPELSSDGVVLAARSIMMLTTMYSQESCSIELTVEALAYLRLGIRSTFGLTSGRYKKRSSEESLGFEEYPKVRRCMGRPNSMYVRVANSDGRLHTKWFSFKHSDVLEIMEQRMRDCAQGAQAYFDDHNVDSVEGP